MGDDKQKRIEQALRRADSQMKFHVDEGIADFRRCWSSWPKRKRRQFKTWVDQAVALKEQCPRFTPYVTLHVEFFEPVGDDDYHTFSPPLQSVKAAIECWERGELYTPTQTAELF
jgi:hypothetical protein